MAGKERVLESLRSGVPLVRFVGQQVLNEGQKVPLLLGAGRKQVADPLAVRDGRDGLVRRGPRGPVQPPSPKVARHGGVEGLLAGHVARDLPHDPLHHRKVLQGLMGLVKRLAREELHEDATDGVHVGGVRPSSDKDDLGGPVVTRGDHRGVMRGLFDGAAHVDENDLVVVKNTVAGLVLLVVGTHKENILLHQI